MGACDSQLSIVADDQGGRDLTNCLVEGGFQRSEPPASIHPPMLREEIVHHIAGNVGQPEIATGMAEGEPLVIETQ